MDKREPAVTLVVRVGLRAAGVVAALWISLPAAVLMQAPPLRVFTTRAIRTVLDQVGPEFERSRRQPLDITTDIAAPMVRRIRGGEPFDVLVAAPDQIDALVTDGLIVPETRTDLARSGIGVAVRDGASVPDVRSVDAFKRTLLNARTIAYLKEGQSGVYLARLLEELGIAAAIEHKVVRPDRDVVSQLVAQGDVEVGMVVVTQILTTAGVTLAGPLPEEIQNYVVFTAGVSARSRAVPLARELLAFLAGPAARAVMRSQGLQPASEAGR
jgi:molybdate transport system substrate-binding protein